MNTPTVERNTTMKALSLVTLTLAACFVAAASAGDPSPSDTVKHTPLVMMSGRVMPLPAGDGIDIGSGSMSADNVSVGSNGTMRFLSPNAAEFDISGNGSHWDISPVTDGPSDAAEIRLFPGTTTTGRQALDIWENGYSNPVTAIGGLIPGSDTNALATNYGTYQGQGVTDFKFPVGFNGQTQPLYTIDILSDEPHVFNTDWKIRIGWAGSASFDTNAGCTVSPCEGAGVYSQANLTHASGTAPLIASGLHGRASISGAGVLAGDRAYSIWGEDGLVRLDGPTTIGLAGARVALSVFTDASVLQGSTTTAQAAATGTLLDLRQGAAHNYIGFSNPDATDGGIVINNVSNSGDGYFVYKNSTGWLVGAQNQTVATITSAKATFISAVQINGAGGETIYGGTGSPNGAVTGNPGDMYLNKSGGAGVTLYVKESGTGTNTGWVGK